MPEYVGIIVYAGLANLEIESVSTFANQATLEKETVSVFAGLANLERVGIITFASLTNLEAPAEALRTFAVLADLGAPADVKITFACITDLIYYVTPPLEISSEIKDRRSDSGGVKYPVYQAIHKLTLEAGLLEVSLRIKDNVEIKQITFSTPDLDSGTAKVQLMDGIGAQIYESRNQSQSTIAALLSVETDFQAVPIVPGTTLKVVASKTQAAAVQFIVILYGI